MPNLSCTLIQKDKGLSPKTYTETGLLVFLSTTVARRQMSPPEEASVLQPMFISFAAMPNRLLGALPLEIY